MATINLKSAFHAMQPLPDIKHIVDGVIAEGTVGVPVGESGGGKSYAWMWAAACIARGEPFLGHKVKQGPILYIDEESNEALFQRRLQKVLAGSGGDENTLFFYTSLAGFDLRKGPDQKQLKDLIVSTRAVFVVIDALMDVMPGADENTVKDIMPVFKAARQIANDTKCAILFIHHLNKMGSFRGSSAIKGAVDFMIQMKREGSLITFSTEKARDTEPFEFTGKMVFTEDEFRLESAKKIPYGKVELFVLEYLSKNPKSTNDEMAKACPSNIEPKSVRQTVNNLTDKALVLRVDTGGNGVAGIYDLTREGKKIGIEKQWINDPWVAADVA